MRRNWITLVQQIFRNTLRVEQARCVILQADVWAARRLKRRVIIFNLRKYSMQSLLAYLRSLTFRKNLTASIPVTVKNWRARIRTQKHMWYLRAVKKMESELWAWLSLRWLHKKINKSSLFSSSSFCSFWCWWGLFLRRFMSVDENNSTKSDKSQPMWNQIKSKRNPRQNMRERQTAS